jgi:hypothetical protein
MRALEPDTRKEMTAMKYETPQLVVVGSASHLVQGVPGGMFDNDVSTTSHSADGVALGLDD